MSIENIKKLRVMTGAGIMDVKKALEASNDDIDKAIKWLRENGISKAAKKVDRIAAEGVINIVKNKNKILILEVNTETDFVASNDKFQKGVKEISNTLLKSSLKSDDLKNASVLKINNESLEMYLTNLTSIIGEKIHLRRFKSFEIKNNFVNSYVHANSKIGTIVVGENIDETILRDISMHIAAMNPLYLEKNNIPKEKVDYEKKLAFKELAGALKGKPEKIQEGMINGKINKIFSDAVLLEQTFVKDNSKKIKDIIGKGKILDFIRYEVGEGLEKREENFADEVEKIQKNIKK